VERKEKKKRKGKGGSSRTFASRSVAYICSSEAQRLKKRGEEGKKGQKKGEEKKEEKRGGPRGLTALLSMGGERIKKKKKKKEKEGKGHHQRYFYLTFIFPSLPDRKRVYCWGEERETSKGKKKKKRGRGRRCFC